MCDCGCFGTIFNAHLTSDHWLNCPVVYYCPQDMRVLTSLNLSSNALKAEGAKIVVEAIKVTNCAIAVILAPFVCPSDHW